MKVLSKDLLKKIMGGVIEYRDGDDSLTGMPDQGNHFGNCYVIEYRDGDDNIA